MGSIHTANLKVLLIEGDRDDAEVVKQRLKEHHPHWQVEVNGTLEAAIARLSGTAWRPDLILTDLQLPDASGVTTVRRLRACCDDIPMIVLTGMEEEALRVLCEQEGGLEFLTKRALLDKEYGLELETRIVSAIERQHHFQMLKQILDCSPTGQVVTSEVGDILYFNASAEQMFAGSPGLRLGDPFGVPLAASDKPTRIQSPDGRIIEMRAVPMNWNQQACHLAVLQDISAHVYRELDLRERSTELQAIVDEQTEHLIQARDAAEAGSRAKSEFLSKVSHELRTPMHTILGVAELLLFSVEDKEGREAINTLLKAGDSMIGLIENLLDISQADSGNFALHETDFDPLALVNEVASAARSRAERIGLEFFLHVPAGNPGLLRGDPKRLRQILNNLISNALHHTDKGSITLELEYSPADGEGKELHFLVQDTGRGVPEEHVGKIFDAFYQVDNTNTRRHGGAGLGLSISKRLAEQMGGHIGLRSTPGKGSQFWLDIKLPEANPRPSPVLAKTEPSTPYQAPAGTMVLVVDDDPGNQDICRRMLQRLNCEVAIASDGVKGLELWEAGDFDLVLMDFNMPNMDGLAATREIRQREAQRPGSTIIIGLTADVREATILATQDCGMDQMLTKPLSLRDLAEMLRSCLTACTARHPLPRFRKFRHPDCQLFTRHPEAL